MTEAKTKHPNLNQHLIPSGRAALAGTADGRARRSPVVLVSVLVAAAALGIACLVGIACSPFGQLNSSAASAGAPPASSTGTPEVSLTTADGSLFRLSAQRG